MTANGLLQIAIFCAIVAALAVPLGIYMARVFAGERTFLSPVLRPGRERAIYWASGVDAQKEQHWLTYAVAMLLFHLFCFASLYAMLRLQFYLPFNPQGMTGVSLGPGAQHGDQLHDQHQLAELRRRDHAQLLHPDGRAHGPQLRLGCGRHRHGHRAHPRLRAAVGADRRQLLGRSDARDALHVCCRSRSWSASPLSGMGMPQNLDAYVDATTLEGAKQTIAQGPVASQIVIKTVGTNGGGFFNANAAHPYENPTALSNLLTVRTGVRRSALALTMTFGRMVGNMRQGWALFGVMGILFLCGVLVSYWAESAGNPAFASARRRSDGERDAGRRQHGGQGGPLRDRQLLALRDDDDRIRPIGAVNSMHDSYTPIGGLRADRQHAAGRGRSSAASARGLYGMLLFAHHRAVHRRPDGRAHAGISRQEARGPRGQDGHAGDAGDAHGRSLVFTGAGHGAAGRPGRAARMPARTVSARSSTPIVIAGNNNGSAFAGLTGNTPFYNLTGADRR